MSTSEPKDPFRTERLIFRAAESPQDDDFFTTIGQDAIGFINSNGMIAKPQGRKQAKEFQDYIMDSALIGCVICLPADADTTSPASETTSSSTNAASAANNTNATTTATPTAPQPIPIGIIHLNPVRPGGQQHRKSCIGIDIAPGYQNKGYGTEALKWMLNWGFETAGLHRIEINCFEYNYGARRLYERLGFVPEGRGRESFWQYGRFWDDFHFSMLDREWWEIQRKEKELAAKSANGP